MAINCNTFSAVAIECKDNIGGLKKLWVTAYDEFTYTVSGTTGTNAGIVATIHSGLTAFFELNPVRYSASATETQAIDTTNSLWKQSIVATFIKNEAAKRNLMLSLAKSIVVAIGKDRNDRYWLYGSDIGLQVATTQTTGAAAADKNIWTVTLEADEAYPAYEVSASAMTLLDV